MFDIGQEVVCVDDSRQSIDGSKDVYEGKHYIIRWIGDCTHPLYGSQLCVRLEGVTRRNDELAAFVERFGKALGLDPEIADMPFRANRFAPIKKTDISVFKEILEKTPEMENV